MSKRTVVLVILDGWGIGKADESNPIHVVNPQNINYLRANFPSGNLQASGISVGLPWGEEGNSEVGHLILGAGKTLYQYFPKITLAIRDQSFFKNEVLKKAFAHAKKNDSAVNLVGLLSAGNVHSSLEHLEALIQFAEEEKISKLNLHLFTDGRDSPPNSAMELLKKIPINKLASLSGRFYAMDRDAHWERTKKAYDVLTGGGPLIETSNIETHLKETYDRKFNDEYIEPTLIGPENRAIKDGDALVFFDFREDRMRQIASPFILKSFNNFSVKTYENLYIATMTPYEDDFKVPAAFEPEKVQNPLGKVLAENSKTQLRLAETQKYPHVTYFFNGLKEEPFQNEYRILIPSSPTLRQEEHPEMMAQEVTARLLESIEEKVFDFILVNYANPDMIAHTGNYDASVKAVRVIDEQVGKITESCLRNNAFLIITSDHGNIERVFNPQTGMPETQHDPSPVPIYLAAPEFKRIKTDQQIRESERGSVGVLADIAPTILELMGIPKPAEMTGQSLVRLLLSNY
jgi:2,3-bisphosphoglycerate-independent phosphoglycerate mutase